MLICDLNLYPFSLRSKSKVRDAPWNNGNRDPGWGVAEIQKMSPPTTVGDVADMQLCVIKQGSPPVLGNVAFFVTDLLTLARCAVCILVR